MDSTSFKKELKKSLEYQKTLGLEWIPMGESTKSKARNPKQIQKPKTQNSNINKAAALENIRKEMGNCQRCPLGKTRTQLVFGEGNPDSDLMFIGEGPGQDEDLQGRPFVGRAGKLLDKIIQAMGYKREEVYIGNVVKSRPPNNRAPEPEEVAACMPFLLKQIEVIEPKIIVCLGATATKWLLNTEVSISKLRGTFIDWNGIQIMPTYHPAFLLRNSNMKRPVWEDMQKVMGALK